MACNRHFASAEDSAADYREETTKWCKSSSLARQRQVAVKKVDQAPKVRQSDRAPDVRPYRA